MSPPQMGTTIRLERLESKVDKILQIVLQLADEKEWITAPVRSDSEVKYVNAHTELLERYNTGRNQLDDCKKQIEKLSEDCRRSTTLTPQKEITKTAQHINAIHTELPMRIDAATPPELLRSSEDRISFSHKAPPPPNYETSFSMRSDSFRELQHMSDDKYIRPLSDNYPTHRNDLLEEDDKSYNTIINNSDSIIKEIAQTRRILNRAEMGDGIRLPTAASESGPILEKSKVLVAEQSSIATTVEKVSAKRLHVSPVRKKRYSTSTSSVWIPCGDYNSKLLVDGNLALHQSSDNTSGSVAIQFASAIEKGDALTFSIASRNPKSCLTISSCDCNLLLTSSGHHNGDPNNKLFPLLSDSPLLIIITRTAAAVTVRTVGTMTGPKWLVESSGSLILKFELYPTDSITFQKATAPQLISPGADV